MRKGLLFLLLILLIGCSRERIQVGFYDESVLITFYRKGGIDFKRIEPMRKQIVSRYQLDKSTEKIFATGEMISFEYRRK